MKRDELKAGAEYAVLSPSQRGQVDDVYGPNARHVIVIDPAPLWYSSHAPNWSRTPKSGMYVTPDGVVEYRDDYSVQATTDWALKDAARQVKVLEVDTYGGPVVTTVPLSNIALTWEAFQTRRSAAKDRGKRERLAEAIRQRELEDAAEALERDAEALGITLHLDKYRGTAKFTFAELRELLGRVS